MASLARSLEKDTETREKDAEPDKKIKQKLTPQIHYTPPPPFCAGMSQFQLEKPQKLQK